MAEPYLGEIMIFAGNFAPVNWAFCNGQLLQISTNTPLFSLLGTNYGGNGQTNFGLPDLRSRVPLHFGQGNGLPNYPLGAAGGAAQISLSIANMPAHNHTFSPTGATATVQAGNGTGQSTSPGGNYLCNAQDVGSGSPSANFGNAQQAGTLANLAGVALNFPAGAIGVNGSSTPFNIMPPYLALNYVICISGLYPTRN